MGEWREYKISDIADVIGGGTPKTSVDEYWNGDIPWLSVVDFNTGRKYISKTEKTITNLGLEKSSTKLLQANDIIISARGTIGALAVLDKPMAFNQSCYGMRAKEDLTTSGYLFYLLKDTVKQLQQASYGAVFDTITRNTFDETTISLPPLKEQKAIAEVLSSLDDKIDLLHRQNKILEEMASALFRQWFIEEAKDEWEVVKLEDILTITSSKRIFYSEYESSGVPFYRSKEIIELHNTGQTKGELFISEERYNEIIEKFGSLTAGDILLTSVGTLGIPYRVSEDDKFYFKDGNLTWFKNFKKLSSLIIFYWLKSDMGREELNAVTIGSTQAALTIKSLKNIQLSLPPKNIIDKLENQLIVIDDKFQANLKQIKTLEKMRDTFLPKLMSGEVRVKHG